MEGLDSGAGASACEHGAETVACGGEVLEQRQQRSPVLREHGQVVHEALHDIDLQQILVFSLLLLSLWR